MDADCVRLLNSRFKPNFIAHDNEGYITLTTHNYQADQINDTKLAAIEAKPLVFNAVVRGTFPENTYPTKEELVLKVAITLGVMVRSEVTTRFREAIIPRLFSMPFAKPPIKSGIHFS